MAFQRRQTLAGVYNIHTNFMQYPKIMQPTRVRWEYVKNNKPRDDGVSRDDEMMIEGVVGERERTPLSEYESERHPNASKFMVVDAHFDTPSASPLGYFGTGSDFTETDFSGLTSVSADVANVLPENCGDVFRRICAQERQWRQKWGREDDSAMRAKIRVTYNM